VADHANVIGIVQSTRTKDMARTAQEFLTDWRKSYIYAEARAPDELDDTVAECVKDAAQDGITRDALDKAAGGDLRTYVKAAISEAGGGDA
jgi:hypothetical protein